MRLTVRSIGRLGGSAERAEAFGRYRVVLDVDGREEVLTYAVELSPGIRSVSWTPQDSILADRRVDVLVVARLTDLVVALHGGEKIELPLELTPLDVGPDTAVIRD